MPRTQKRVKNVTMNRQYALDEFSLQPDDYENTALIHMHPAHASIHYVNKTDKMPGEAKAISSKSYKTPWQARFLDYNSQFTADIRYIKGESNIVADTLSRIGETNTISYLDYDTLIQSIG